MNSTSAPAVAQGTEWQEVQSFTPILDFSFADYTLPSAIGLAPIYSSISRQNAATGEKQYYTDEDGRVSSNQAFSQNPWAPMTDRLRIYAYPQT
ncbi:MAG TPA: hypothetical protein VGD81_21300, partial [Opitutaceae bacterium]